MLDGLKEQVMMEVLEEALLIMVLGVQVSLVKVIMVVQVEY